MAVDASLEVNTIEAGLGDAGNITVPAAAGSVC